MKPELIAALIDALECAIETIESMDGRDNSGNLDPIDLSDLKTILSNAKAQNASPAIDAAGASSGDVRKQLTEALGLPTNGIRDGKPVGFAWDYLVAMVRDLAAGASEWQAEPVAYMRTYRAYRDDQSAAPDPGVLVTSFHQNHEYAKQGPGENTPLYLHPSAEIAALRERIAGMEKEAITREWVIVQLCEFAAQMANKGVRWGMEDAIKFFDAAISKEPKP